MPLATAKRYLSQEAPNAVPTECFWNVLPLKILHRDAPPFL